MPLPTLAVVVTDHALLPYLERALEIDVEALRTKLAAEVTVPASLRASTPIVMGTKFCLRYEAPGKAVVSTVLTREMGAADLKRHTRLKNNHIGKSK